MTLVLGALSRDTAWLVADRRLSYGRGIPPIDDAVKVMIVEAVDAVAGLGYAGLGATSPRYGAVPVDEWITARSEPPIGAISRHPFGRGEQGTAPSTSEMTQPIGGHFILAPAF